MLSPSNKFIFLNLLICFSSVLFSQEYPYLFRSGYMLSRGDTGIAVAEDEQAIFYNPAGLAQGKGVYKKTVLASPLIEISKDTRDVAKQISLQDADITETLRKRLGKPEHFALGNFSGILLRKAAIGLVASSSVTSLLSKQAKDGSFEGIEASVKVDGGATFTLADKFFGDYLFAGLTFKYLQRLQGYINANATETDQLKNIKSDQYAMLGSGMGFDIGFIHQVKSRTPYSFGLTIQDIGNTAFTPKKPTEVPKKDRPLKDIQQTVNFGFAVTPQTQFSKLRLLFDVRDLLNNTKNTIYKRLHIGGEFSILDMIGFAVGLNQGYSSSGFYFNIRFIRLDIGMYSEEVGETAGLRPDQRFFLQLTMGL